MKFILILILLSYLIYKVGGFLFKIFFITASNAQRDQSHRGTTSRRKAPNSNLNIDIPSEKVTSDKNKGFSGGDYVDYEEVK